MISALATDWTATCSAFATHFMTALVDGLNWVFVFPALVTSSPVGWHVCGQEISATLQSMLLVLTN